jgi:hypothetical protein
MAFHNPILLYLGCALAGIGQVSPTSSSTYYQTGVGTILQVITSR